MRIILSAFLIITVGLIAISCTSGPAYNGPKSDHFDGKYFHNRTPMNKGFWDYLVMRIKTKQTPWPTWINSKEGTLPNNFLNGDQLKVLFINHSTVLLRFENLTILTDPIFSQRASPFSWFGPKRARDPYLKIDQLPKIDVILISHNHYDHLDIESLKTISKRDQPKILCGLGVGLLLKENNIDNFIELDWEKQITISSLKFTFVYSQHWSARGIFDRKQTLWGSYILESPKGKIYFSGDTGYSSHFKEQGDQYGPFKFAMLPIGHYEPGYFMGYSHLNPEQAVLAHLDLRSQLTMGIHFGTFQLTNESISQPLEDLEKAKKVHSINETFFAPNFGEYREISFP